MIKTFEQACEFVFANRICTIFGSKNSPYLSLWDNVDLSEEKPEGGGWSEKVMAVWAWKNEIPATFPDEVFYGKVKGGDAVLIEMEYLKNEHFAKAYQPVAELDELAQIVYGYIEDEPSFTGDLRKITMTEHGCTKSRFDGALKRLQISMNVVRSNDPSVKNDLWLPFHDLYPNITID